MNRVLETVGGADLRPGNHTPRRPPRPPGETTLMKDDKHLDLIRLSEAKRQELLAKISSNKPSQTRRQRREHERYEYRQSYVHVEATHPGGGVGRYVVCARNLSAGGMSFVHGGFLHTGSELRITLPAVGENQQVVLGKVVMCRHLAGSLHEVGVQFHEKIDPFQFLDPQRAKPDGPSEHRPAQLLAIELLCVDESEADRLLIEHHLRGSGAHLVTASHLGAALDRVKRQPFDVVLCSLDCSDKPGIEAIKALRQAGFAGPIIALTAENEPSDAGANTLAGVVETLVKPIERDPLLDALNRVAPASGVGAEPIYSQLSDDPSAIGLLENYLQEVSQLIGQMNYAMGRSDFAQVRSICQRLKGTGSAYGFAPVSESARSAVQALDAARSVDSAQEQLKRLESLCRRLRIKP